MANLHRWTENNGNVLKSHFILLLLLHKKISKYLFILKEMIKHRKHYQTKIVYVTDRHSVILMTHK